MDSQKPDRESEEAKILLDSILDGAWQDANTAMNFYIGYRTRYNLPYSTEMWADDFSLGFRDAIAHVHFSMRTPNIPREMMFRWVEEAFPDDNGLAHTWLSLIGEGRSERAQHGMACGFILESWRIGQEFSSGALVYIAEQEKSYLDQYPDASKFQSNHWLILSHFVLPLLEEGRYVHPKISDHFSQRRT